MIAFSQPAALLLLIPAVLVTTWLWHAGRVQLHGIRRAVALGLRVAILCAIVLGLAGTSLRLPQTREAVVMVADLSASDARDKSAMQDSINSAAQARSAGNQLGVVSTAGDAAVEAPVSGVSGFDGFQTTVDSGSTNLETGLELAGSIMPDGLRRRVVLLSDGQQTAGDAVLAARLLRSRGIRLDVMPQHVAGGGDVLVEGVSAPSQLRTGERSSLTVYLHSTLDTSVAIDIYRDRSLIVSQRRHVGVGSTHYVFPQGPLSRGLHRYEVRLNAEGDRQPGNNAGSAFTIVGGPPRVLVLSASPSEARNVLAGLRTTGIAADFRTPGHAVASLTWLQNYASIVVVDTPAEVLGRDLMAQLVPFVRDLGHGLVVIGGQHAYGLGGYGGTPIEQALPVKMDLPRRPDLPNVGVVLIVESLEANLPINLSKAAAKGVVQLLSEQDRVAVNYAPDGTGLGWAVRLRPVSDKLPIDRAIDSMAPEDPQSYVPVLREAYNALAKSPTRLKHIILLGDGDAHDTRYARLATEIHRHGVTISTVVTNALEKADRDTMRTIAKKGGGRYYEANNIQNIPKVFLHEARTVARTGVVTGTFSPRVVSPSPILRDLHSVPPLDGYVATTPKRRAEVILTSNKLDPVLAGWQFGLGRSAVWTSDAAGLWTKKFVAYSGTNRFWAGLVSWTMPASGGNQLFVSASRSQGTAHVAVDIPSALGPNPRVRARISPPNAPGTSILLQPSAPGVFSGAFPATAQGAYFVTVDAKGDGHAAVGQGGLSVAYPDEYRSTGTDRSLLLAVAQAGGGSVISRAQDVWNGNLPAVYDQRPLKPYLWLLAILLLPIDIAVRRLIVTRRDLESLRETVVRLRTRARAA